MPGEKYLTYTSNAFIYILYKKQSKWGWKATNPNDSFDVYQNH